MTLARPKVGVISIATNGYIEYWFNMVRSAMLNTKLDNLNFYLFTNDVEKADAFGRLHPQLNLQIFEIDNYKWPEATLLRYEIMLSRKLNLKNEILIYLDADMIIHRDLFEEAIESAGSWESGIALVSHPGFWRPKALIRFYLRNPKTAFGDLRLLVKMGGLGTWERNKMSSAYVARKLRKSYFCGGIWMGRKIEFITLIAELDREVRSDLNKGIVAIWHDESHLNSWGSINNHGTHGPELCFDPSYNHLKGIVPVVEAVNKEKYPRIEIQK